MSIYADFCLYLQSKHDQNTTILLDRHGLEMPKMAWIAHVFSGKKRDSNQKESLENLITSKTHLTMGFIILMELQR
jgi:hypothetical protein